MLEDVRANRGAGLLTLAMVLTLRAGHASRKARGARAVLAWPARILASIVYRPLAILLNCSVPFSVSIGRRVQWGHGFNGVFVSRNAVIGDDCIILHQVTIGSKYGSPGEQRSPVIGHGVLIGAGAKIIGGVTIGDGARIGANALVVDDVPADAICFAPPAQVRLRKSNNG